MPKATSRTDRTPAKRATRATKTPRRPRATRTAAAAPAITHEAIALRAYEIHQTEMGGDPVEHWLRAERELVGA